MIWRKVKRHTWTENITKYEEILWRVNEVRTIGDTIPRKKKLIGHIIKEDGADERHYEAKIGGHEGTSKKVFTFR